MRKFPPCIIDPSQGTLICLVQRLWQFCQHSRDIFWEAVANVDHLTIHPFEPMSQKEVSESHQEFSIDRLHPIRFFYEDVDGQFPVLFIPPFYFTRVNDRLDVVLDIPPLSILVMQGNTAEN